MPLLLLVGGHIAPAHADIVFTPGNNPQPNEENVLFNLSSDISGPATLITGHLNQSGASVTFSSSTLLFTPSQGQARIEGCAVLTPGCGTPATYNDLAVSLTKPPGGVFTDLIFDLNAATDGDLTITVIEGNGTVQQATFANGISHNGNNFYTVVATNGQDIDTVLLNTAAEITDTRQIRLSGASVLSAVPEPSSLMLFGAVLSMVAYRFQRRIANR